MENELFLQLGYFAKLPPEIRLDIWEHLFSSCQIRKQLPQSDSDSEPRNLFILYTNRYLYADISTHLYSSIKHTIRISPRYHRHKWMTAKVASKGLKIEWDLDDKEAARRYFLNFPHDKVPLRVNIHAPNCGRKDPGQILLLRQKVTALTDRLMAVSEYQERPRNFSLRVNFVGEWERKGKPIRSRLKVGRVDDYKLVVKPFFLLLVRWNNRADMSDDMRMAIEAAGGQDDIGFVPRYMEIIKNGLEEYSKLKGNAGLEEVDYIHKCETQTSMVLDKKLDDLRGETANMLRLERFSKWFEDGDSWKSAYQEQHLSDLHPNIEWFLERDPKLRTTIYRFNFLIIMNYVIHAENDDKEEVVQTLESNNPRIYTTWDSSAWSTAFPNGIPRFSRIELPDWIAEHETGIYMAYRKYLPPDSRFSDRLCSWVPLDPVDVFSRHMGEDYYCELCLCNLSPCPHCAKHDPGRLCRLCRDFYKTGKRIGRGVVFGYRLNNPS